MGTWDRLWGGALGMLSVAAIALGGCGHSDGSAREVTVRLEVTAVGPPVAWVGNIGDTDLSGTTPSTQELEVTVPGETCGVAVGCSRPSIVASVRTTATTPLTVCLTNLENGKRSCRMGTSPVIVIVDS